MTKKCSVDGCERKYAKGGFCDMHYQRNRVHGSPHAVLRKVFRGLSLIESFEKRLNKNCANGCWEWTAGVSPKGYGKLGRMNEYGEQLAHRLAYRLYIGYFDRKLLVCHHCDNPKCCNPKHLFVGTVTDNTHDMILKGRDRSFGKARSLSDEAIREIRDRNNRAIDLIEKHGISRSMIGLIRSRKAYANVI